MERNWITDRPPTEVDGDGDGYVRMKLHPDDPSHSLVHWSYVGPGAPWQHTSFWEPPTEPKPAEPDRIAALEQQVADVQAEMRYRTDSLAKDSLSTMGLIIKQDDLIANLEGRAAESIHALERRVAELEAQLRPSTEQPEVSVPAAVFISSEALL